MTDQAKHRRLVRIGLALAALAIFMYAVWSAYDHQATMRWLRELRPVPYFAVFALLPLVGIPATPLYIVAGASFGIAIGLVGSWIALAINAALCFWIAHRLRPVFERLLRRFRTELPDLSERGRDNVRFVVGVKLAPGAPTFVKQYALGMSGVSFRLYMLVTMLVSGTYAAAFVIVGESLLDHRPDRTVIAGGALAVLVAVGMWYRHRKKTESGPQQPEAQPT